METDVTDNAHPHFSPSADSPRIALSHNGIIENYEELRATLKDLGYVFSSQTDSEAIAHLTTICTTVICLTLYAKRLHACAAVTRLR